MGCIEEEDNIDFVKSWPKQTEDERSGDAGGDNGADFTR
jgi:hypothetical protein